MRILHVINTLKTGGAEKLVSEIVPLMIKDGLEVEVAVFVCKDSPLLQNLLSHNVTVHIFRQEGSVYNPLHIVRLRKLIRRFDIIHTHNTSPQVFGVIAHLGMKNKLCTTEHGGSNRRRKHKVLSFFDRLMYKKYNSIICISDKAEESLRKYINSKSKKIKIIYNGIDVDKFVNARPLTEFRNSFPANTKIICMVAGFRWEKDQDTLIKGMTHLPENYILIFAGIGPRMQECEALAEKLGIKDRVKFLGLQNNIPSLLKSSDFIVMSSHFEGLSLSSLEGMAAGKPFLASDVDGLREVVMNTGLLFPHGDSETFAKMVTDTASDQEVYNRLCAQGQARAKEYDIRNMVAKYENEYSSLISEK